MRQRRNKKIKIYYTQKSERITKKKKKKKKKKSSHLIDGWKADSMDCPKTLSNNRGEIKGCLLIMMISSVATLCKYHRPFHEYMICSLKLRIAHHGEMASLGRHIHLPCQP